MRLGYVQLIKAVTGSFDSDFEPLLIQVNDSRKDVNEAIRLAEAKVSSSERQLQAAAREAAEKRWNSEITHRKERAKAEAERLAQKQLDRHREYVWVTRTQTADWSCIGTQQASMLDELSSFDYKTALRRAQLQRHGSTGQWLVHTQQFTQWLAGNESQSFWCTGKLGSGKTVLTGFAVEHVSAQRSHLPVKIVCFFCQYNNEISLQATTILRSILRQLLDQDMVLFKAIEPQLETLLEQNPLDVTRLEHLLSDILKSIKSTYPVVMIIDGLDECSERQMKLVLKALRNVKLLNPRGLKLYLAGDDRITDLITTIIDPAFVVYTQSTEASSDMEELVRQLVFAKREDGDLTVGDMLLFDEIVEALSKGAQGM